MLGSDKHHICLKGANINDLYSSYHKRTCNDRGLLQRRYKVNKKRCRRNKISFTESEKDFIQTHLDLSWILDVIKGVYPDRISCSMRTLYQLADRGIFKKENLPWKGKRKPKWS